MKQAQAFIETRGLTAAVTVSDIALKSANVELIGIERSRGKGYITVKLQGDVGAVNAAVDAATNAMETRDFIVSKTVIARPANGLEMIVYSKDTIGLDQQEESVDQKDSEDVQEEETDEIEMVEETQDTDQSEDSEELEEASCNICHDPACPRKKGEPKVNCIHANDEEKMEV